jgi:hypothetical protein
MKVNQKIMATALLVCAFAGSYAQRQKKSAIAAECLPCGTNHVGISVLNYVTDQQKQYVISGCVPGSDVELYSNPSGGQVVATEVADEKGTVTFKVAMDVPVAFVLNHNRVNANGVAGNGHVIQIPQPAVSLNNFELSSFAGDVVLRWKAAIAAGDWVFVVQRSKDNVSFTDVDRLTGRESNGEVAYDFTAPKQAEAGSFYRIEARDVSGARIATQALMAKNSENAQFEVQPTVFSNSVQITMPQHKLPATFVIADLAGRTQYVTGRISTGRQTIQVPIVATGTYILQITDVTGLRSSKKIIKN